MLHTITDRAMIRQILRHYLAGNFLADVVFIPAINAKPGFVTYEGARPISCARNDTEEIYSFTNGDSKYTSSVGSLDLKNIASIELLTNQYESGELWGS